MFILNPLKVMADAIPPLDWIVGFGTALFAAILTAICAAVTNAIAWLFYRPLVGKLILALGAGCVFALSRLRRSRPVQGKPA